MSFSLLHAKFDGSVDPRSGLVMGKLCLHILAPFAGCGNERRGVPETPPVKRNGRWDPLALNVEEPPKGLVLVDLFYRIRKARHKL